jgi:hypothetical protein
LDEEDWKRADMYANFIRIFTHTGTEGPKVEKATYYQIQASHKFQPLLPNLLEIYCLDVWKEVYFLLSPSLRRVKIFDGPQRTNSFSSSVSFFVNALPKICPDIQSLEVCVDLSISALRSIQNLTQLQYLGLDFNLAPQSSNIDYITGFSALPNLRLLKLSPPFSRQLESSFWKSQRLSNYPESFCGLHQLDFSASLDVIANALPSFLSSNLTTFGAQVIYNENEDHEIPTEQLWSEVCDTLMKHARSPSSSLRELMFAVTSIDFPPTGVEAFQPLLELRGLETLIFDIPLEDFEDETLGNWASAWPNLKTFELSSSEYFITLSGIIKLLQLCRDLKKLKLGFDASELYLIPEIPPTPPLSHGLKDWDIAESDVTRYTLERVIDILSWVFIDLEDVKSRSDDLEDLPSEVLPYTLKRISRERECW